MQLKKIILARQVLDGLADRNDMDFGLTYLMTKFLVDTSAEQDFYASEVQKIITKYSAKKDDGTHYIPKDNVGKANEEIGTLEATEVDAPSVKLPMSKLSRCLNLSMKQMIHLMDFIEEDK